MDNDIKEATPTGWRLAVRLMREDREIYASVITLSRVLLALSAIISLPLYALALPPSLSPAPRLAVSLTAAILAGVSLFLYSRARPSPSPANALCLALSLVLFPTWFFGQALSNVYLLTRFELWPAWKLVLGLLLFYALPLLLAFYLARQPADRIAYWARGLRVTAVTFLLLLVCLEIGLRVAERKYGWQAAPKRTEGREMSPNPLPDTWQYLPNQTWADVYPTDERGYFEPGHRITYQTNSAGYRDNEFFEQKKPGVIRFALLGDSFAFGEGVKPQDVGANLLEQLLTAKAGCPVEIYNFAVQGYSTRQQAVILDQVALKYNPDAVIVWFFLNDIETHRDQRQFQVINKTSWFLPSLMSVSRVAFWSSQLLKKLAGATYHNRMINSYQPGHPNWEATRGYLQQMERNARASGIPILLFSHPQVVLLQQYPLEQVHKLVVASAQELGYQAFPLSPAFAGHENESLLVHASDQHPNEVAHRLTAHYAADKIAPFLPACPAANAKPEGDRRR